VTFIGGMAQGGTQNIPTPTGFTAIPNTQGGVSGVIACSAAFLVNNVGGITTVTWPTLTNWSSAVMVVYEVSNLGTGFSPLIAGQSLATSAASQNAFAPQTPGLGSLVVLGLIFSNSAQAIGNNSKPIGAFSGTAIQTSTNSQASVVNTSGQGTSVVVRAQGLTGIQPSGSVAVATAVGAVGVILTSLATTSSGQSADHAQQVENGGVYAFGGAGSNGWSLGGTKPGGAGGGQ
jgi:hypothetical protein